MENFKKPIPFELCEMDLIQIVEGLRHFVQKYPHLQNHAQNTLRSLRDQLKDKHPEMWCGLNAQDAVPYIFKDYYLEWKQEEKIIRLPKNSKPPTGWNPIFDSRPTPKMIILC